MCRSISCVTDAFRRLLLQVGVNIRSADRAWQPPTASALKDEKRVPSLLLSTAARDPEPLDTALTDRRTRPGAARRRRGCAFAP